MTKSAFPLFLLFIFSQFAIAQGNDRGIQNDSKAQAILDKVSSKYRSGKSVKLDFTLSVDSPEDELSANSAGKVFLKNEKYRIDTDDMLIICDNVKRWVYLKESNELQIDFYDPEKNEIESPSQLFSIYKEDFHYRALNDEIVNGKKTKLIELIPANIKDSPYTKIHLLVDEAENIIVKAIIKSQDGITYTYGIKSFKLDEAINDSEFSFDASKFPGIHIDDWTK